MERLTGTLRAAELGRPATEMLEFLRDTDVAAHLARAVAGETSKTGDVRYEFPGDVRDGWIAARFVPWRAADGAIGGVIGFHTIVTSRRRRATFVRALEAIGQSRALSLGLNAPRHTSGSRSAGV